MTDIKNVSPLGIADRWRSRKSVIQMVQKMTPWPINRVDRYNARLDESNAISSPPSMTYSAVGARMLWKSMTLALQRESWEREARDALSYLMVGDRLDFFWHVKYRSLFPDSPQPLRTMSWELITETIGLLLSLGRTEEAIYQGYLVHAALNRTYQLQLSYEEKRRKMHPFMLRLFADWRGDVTHAWPEYAYSEPIYEGILERWREPDADVLRPWLLLACDRHTHQSKLESEKVFYDCSAFPRTPLEIQYLFRLRELIGLENPVLDHPLMEPPFDRLPEAQPAYVPDERVLGTLARVREDWPEFDQIVALDALKRA